MAVDDPNAAPWSPWSVPPTTVDLDAELARAYGAPEQQQVLEGLFDPLLAHAVPAPGDPEQLPGADRPFQWNDKGPQSSPEPFNQAEYDAARARGEATGAPSKGDFHNPSQPNPATPLPGAAPRTDAARIGAFGAPWSGEETAAGSMFPAPDSPPAASSDIEMPDDYVSTFQPDAISGADFANVDKTKPPFVEADTRAPGELPDEYLSDEELGQKWSSLPIEEQEKKRGELEGARENLRQAGMIDATTRALKDAEANAQAYATAVKASQQKSMQLDVEAKALADEKIDPLRNISTTSKVLGVLAAFIGGFGMNKSGGRNIGMEAVDSMIDREIQVQSANLSNRRAMLGERKSAIAEQLAMGKDLYHAQETVRLATYDQLVKKLEIDVQQYDPRGTRAVQTMDKINAIKARRAELLAKYQTDQQKRIEAALKEERERVKLNWDREHQINQDRNDATRAYSDATRAKAAAAKDYAEVDEKKAENEVLTVDQLRQRYPTAPAEAFNAGPMSIKKFAKHLETFGKGAEIAKAGSDAVESEAKAAAAEKGYYIFDPETREPMTGKDGKPVPVMDSTKRDRISKVVGAAKNIRILADRMKALRQQNGGNWKALGSAEAQEMQQLVSMIDFETFKAFDLGAPSEGDKALAEGVRGGADPSSFVKNATTGFQAYADAVEKKANTELGGAGIEPLRFTRRGDAPAAKKDVVDDIVKRLAKSDYKPVDPNDVLHQLAPPPQVEANKHAEEDLTALAAFVDQQGERGDLARKALTDLSTKAVSPAVRARAKAMLDALPETHVRGDEAR